MQRATAAHTYHTLEFGATGETAAFLAALARRLNDPGAAVAREEVEIWLRPGTPACLYLSDGALALAAHSFSPVPVCDVVRGADLPEESRLVLDARTPAWGTDDAARRLDAVLAR